MERISLASGHPWCVVLAHMKRNSLVKLTCGSRVAEGVGEQEGVSKSSEAKGKAPLSLPICDVQSSDFPKRSDMDCNLPYLLYSHLYGYHKDKWEIRKHVEKVRWSHVTI
jgi:hypothetical protein